MDVANVNVVKGLFTVTIDFGAADGHVYFAMEYVKGKTLHEVLSRWGALSERPALRITRQIALALQHANRHKIVHRDIKPSNILVTKTGLAKLADFGLAIDRSRARPGPKERTFGTPWFMPPEQVRGEEVDIRGDIYGLGATLYRTLAGKPPNEGSTLEEVLRHCLKDPAPDPRAIRPGISEPSARLVMDMMAKTLPDRIQTPEALIERIDSVLAILAPTSDEPLEALVDEPGMESAGSEDS